MESQECSVSACSARTFVVRDGVPFCAEHWTEESSRRKALAAKGILCDWSGCGAEYSFQVDDRKLCRAHAKEYEMRERHPGVFSAIDVCTERAGFIRQAAEHLGDSYDCTPGDDMAGSADDWRTRIAIHDLRADLFEATAALLRGMAETSK